MDHQLPHACHPGQAPLPLRVHAPARQGQHSALHDVRAHVAPAESASRPAERRPPRAHGAPRAVAP
eukprot:7573694-Pyramimonas_sp.AAC.1